jgi:hypothetical protein
MSEIIDLSTKRAPVTYVVTITHHWDGTLESFVQDVADNEHSRASVAYALKRVAESYFDKSIKCAGDAMLEVMLANIDHAMGATDDEPAIFKVTPAELRSWADAVAEYEAARFPDV